MSITSITGHYNIENAVSGNNGGAALIQQQGAAADRVIFVAGVVNNAESGEVAGEKCVHKIVIQCRQVRGGGSSLIDHPLGHRTKKDES